MNFDSVNKLSCVVAGAGTGPNGSGGGGGGGPDDPRCSDSKFAAANPDICGSASYLILKPATSLIARLGSISFEVFEYINSVESRVLDSLQFTSSDTSVFVVGVSSGSGTGVAAGQVVVTVTRNGKTASATVTVLDSTIGCKQTHVKSSILIDDSKSMSLGFGGAYATRLDFAKAIARAYAGNIVFVSNVAKDSIKIWSFDDTPTQISSDFISDATQLTADINSVAQTTLKTDLAGAIVAATSDLIAAVADEKVLIIITDGEQSDAPSNQDVISAASQFTNLGGVIVCVGARASLGFDLLERIATGGFFINAKPSNVADAFGATSFLKSSVCAGICVPVGDVTTPTAALNYSGFENWSVIAGQVNLLGNGFEDFLPGNGLYVELAENSNPATLESIDSYPVESGDIYEFSLRLAGNNQVLMPVCQLKMYIRDNAAAAGDPNLFERVFPVSWNDGFATASASFTAQYDANVRLFIQYILPSGYVGTVKGCLIDTITFKDTTTMVTLLTDSFDTENEVYTPPACGASAAIPAIDDPAVPSIQFLNYGGGAQVSGETYKYAISYVTANGETAASTVVSTASLTPVSVPHQATQVYSIFPDPALYPVDRVIGIRIWRNDSSGSSTLYLLADIGPENTSYIDLENHTQFAARANTGVTAPVTNTTAVATGGLGHGSAGCYSDPCDSTVAVDPQSPDSTPLPDIEGGGSTGGGGFQSTQQACVSCPAGASSSLTPAMTGLTTPSGICSTNDGNARAYFAFDKQFATDVNPCNGWWRPGALPTWVQYQLPAAKTCTNYAVSALPNTGGCPPATFHVGPPTDWQLQGSNDGTTWTTLDTQTGQSFSAATQYINQYSISAPLPYLYYRLYITATINNEAGIIPLLELSLYGTGAAFTICKQGSAAGSSQASADHDATIAATAAANQELQTLGIFGCLPVFSATRDYTAFCDCGSFGPSVTKNVTYVSTVSQQDAETRAGDLAVIAANNARVCTDSNNAQVNNIKAGPANAQASIYPSVKYVTGFVGNSSNIVLTLTGLTVKGFENFDILLMSPTGRVCAVKAHGGETGDVFTNFTLMFADSGATTIPNNTLPINGHTYKPTQEGSPANFPGCVPVAPWLTTLNALAGQSPNGAWSLWIRSVANTVGASSLNSWALTIT